jgi:septation ring formation regulator EzrA
VFVHVQAALAEKEAQLVKQAEARTRGNSTIVDQLLLKVNEQRQELSTLQDALQQKQGQLLQQQQEQKQLQMQLWEQDSAEMEVRGQLRTALQKAETAEATAASAR